MARSCTREWLTKISAEKSTERFAHVGPDETRLVSRRGNVYKRVTELAAAIRMRTARPQFYDLLRRRDTPVFYAFDILLLDGEDVRSRPLIERKRLLREIVPEQPSVMLYAEHIEGYGVEFFRLACERDLEGIVAKARHGSMARSGSRSGIPSIRSTRVVESCLRNVLAHYQPAEMAMAMTKY